MRAAPAVFGACCCVGLLSTAVCAASQVFATPRLEAGLGYTSNRFLAAGESPSGFGRIAPALELLWLAPDGLELSGHVHHERFEYFRDDYAATRSSWAEAEVYAPLGGQSVGLMISAGSYADGALPLDDHRWLRAAPSLSVPLGEALTFYGGTAVTYSAYDTRRTAAGDEQRDWHWEVHPGLSWSGPGGASLWVEPQVQGLSSNQESDEYTGAGVSVGTDALWWQIFRTGLWGRWQARSYPDGSSTGGTLRESPVSAGGWASLRLTRWAEVTAAGHWLGHDSSESSGDYTVWSAELGLRLVYDWEL